MMNTITTPSKPNTAPKFSLGRVVSTPNALEVLSHDEIMDALHRHSRGDWGELDAEDKKTNDDALKCGERLLSSYRSLNGITYWIITEADRSATTILLPEDY